MVHAIYELSPIGVGGAYEADGGIHYYCSEHCASNHAIAEGFRTSANYSKPQLADELSVLEDTQCEWCGQAVFTP